MKYLKEIHSPKKEIQGYPSGKIINLTIDEFIQLNKTGLIMKDTPVEYEWYYDKNEIEIFKWLENYRKPSSITGRMFDM